MPMDSKRISLCCPDNEKSCFACCPPIRTPGYEHIQYLPIIRRILLENTSQFDSLDKSIKPITGFSCWALGYLDKEFRQVGCLLHPARNKGTDLRYRIDYGKKCSRETCQEEKSFSRLDLNTRKFWLHLADGLDSFTYSSRVSNRLFSILGWGKYLLTLISAGTQGKTISRESFFSEYCFFSTDLSSKGSAYLIARIIDEGNIKLLKNRLFRKNFENFTTRLSGQLKAEYGRPDKGSYVHMLDIDPEFSDFLRISCGISKIMPADAARIRKQVTEDLVKFKGNPL